MYIMSQDKKTLFAVNDRTKITVSEQFTRKKDQKFTLMISENITSVATVTLGAYPEETCAIAVLEQICSALSNNTTVFYMPEKIEII